jgi:hypothetical protein
MRRFTLYVLSPLIAGAAFCMGSALANTSADARTGDFFPVDSLSVQETARSEQRPGDERQSAQMPGTPSDATQRARQVSYTATPEDFVIATVFVTLVVGVLLKWPRPRERTRYARG